MREKRKTLRDEMAAMRDQIAQQTKAIDDLRKEAAAKPPITIINVPPALPPVYVQPYYPHPYQWTGPIRYQRLSVMLRTAIRRGSAVSQ